MERETTRKGSQTARRKRRPSSRGLCWGKKSVKEGKKKFHSLAANTDESGRPGNSTNLKGGARKTHGEKKKKKKKIEKKDSDEGSRPCAIKKNRKLLIQRPLQNLKSPPRKDNGGKEGEGRGPDAGISILLCAKV